MGIRINIDNKELAEKIDWNSLSFLDWLKISAVILIAGLALYRCLLPFRAEYVFREAFGYENRLNDNRLTQEQRSMFAQKAIEKYLQAVRLAPWETYYHTQLGRIYENEARAAANPEEMLAKIEKAERIYDLCLKISPANPWYVARKAEIYGMYAQLEKDPAKQKAWLDKREELIILANELDPNNAIFTLGTASLYLQNKDYDKARERYEHALVIDERLGDAYIGLGELYRQLGDTARQEEIYLTGIAKSPESKNIRLYLGLLYENQGKLKEAIRLYIAEARLDSSNENAYRAVGFASYKDGQWKNMEEAFKGLTRINPANTEYYVFLADAQLRQNKREDAVKSLEAALVKTQDALFYARQHEDVTKEAELLKLERNIRGNLNNLKGS